MGRNVKVLENMLGEQHELEEPTSRIGQLLKAIYEQGGGGGGGTNDYRALTNKPKYNGVTINGDLLASALGTLDVDKVSELPETPTENTLYIVEDTSTTPATVDYWIQVEELYHIEGGGTDDYDELIGKPKIDTNEIVSGNQTHESLDLIGVNDFVQAATGKLDGVEIVLPVGTPSSPTVLSEIDDSAAMKYSSVHTSSNSYLNHKLDTLAESLAGKLNLQFVSEMPASPERNTQYYVETSTAGVWNIKIVDNTGTVHDMGSTELDTNGFVLDTRKVAGVSLANDISASEIQNATKAVTATLMNKTIDADDNTIVDLTANNFKSDVIQQSMPASPTHSQLLSAAAVDTELDNYVPGTRTIASLPLTSNISASQIADKTKAVSSTLTNKTIDAANNTISNLETAHLKSGVLQTSMPSSPTDAQLMSAKAINSLAGFKTLVGENALTLNVSSPVTAMSFNGLADTQLFKFGSLCVLSTMLTFSKSSTSAAWLNVARIANGYRPKRNTAFSGFLWNGNSTNGIGGHASTEGWLRWWVDGDGTAALTNAQLRIICIYECA